MVVQLARPNVPRCLCPPPPRKVASAPLVRSLVALRRARRVGGWDAGTRHKGTSKVRKEAKMARCAGKFLATTQCKLGVQSACVWLTRETLSLQSRLHRGFALALHFHQASPPTSTLAHKHASHPRTPPSSQAATVSAVHQFQMAWELMSRAYYPAQPRAQI